MNKTGSDLRKKGSHTSGGNSSDDLGCQELLNKNGRGKEDSSANKPAQLSSAAPMGKVRPAPAETCEGELLLKEFTNYPKPNPSQKKMEYFSVLNTRKFCSVLPGETWNQPLSTSA